MTKKEVERYQNLDVKMEEQARLILSMFRPLGKKESYLRLDFDDSANFGPKIRIWYTRCSDNGEYNDFEEYPKSYLYMSKEELATEKKRINDELEERIKKICSIAAKAAEKREKRNRDARYKRYLELKKEFEGVTESPAKRSAETSAIRGIGGSPVEEAVYLCKYWEHDDDDPSGCGKTWQWCNNEKSGRNECECKRTYAMQFCPFYKKGKLAGKWVINDADKEAAKKFRQEFEGKEDK